MSTHLEFLNLGPLVTVQDAGRRGLLHVGVSESGPMDWARHRMALRLVGAPAEGAAIEIGLGGLVVRAGHAGAVRLALTGPGFSADVAGATFTAPVSLTLPAGERLVVRTGAAGLWGYLAVAGAHWGPKVLHSHATNARTGLGARDFTTPLPCAAAEPHAPIEWLDPVNAGPVGLLPGPQHHLFSNAAHTLLASTPYTLTTQLDRMGYKLEGEKLVAPDGHDIISDGIVEGAIQVPGNGQPIVLMADRGPTGGYPKIAVVASVDRPRLAQMGPGHDVRFAWTDRATAVRRRATLEHTVDHPERRRRTDFSPQFLAAQNLVGGVWAPEHAPEKSGSP